MQAVTPYSPPFGSADRHNPFDVIGNVLRQLAAREDRAPDRTGHTSIVLGRCNHPCGTGGRGQCAERPVPEPVKPLVNVFEIALKRSQFLQCAGEFVFGGSQ